jgi:uncharacterized membrane protein
MAVLSPAIAVHIAAAGGVLALTAGQLTLSKGTPRHRTLGYAWVALMAVVALSSFAIPTFMTRLMGAFPFGPIHILSIIMLIGLALAVRAARRGDVARHRRIVLILTASFLVTGLFTLLPGRLLHGWVFG